MEGVSYGSWIEDGVEYIVIRTTTKVGETYYVSDKWVKK